MIQNHEINLKDLRKSIESLGVIPEFDQNLLFALERKYLDFIDLRSFKLEDNGFKLHQDLGLRMVKVNSINHLETTDIGLHLQNFSNLLAVLKEPHHTVFGIIKGLKEQTELYYGISENINTPQGDSHIDTVSYFQQNVEAALKSNFPGMKYEIQDSEKISNIINVSYWDDKLKINALPGIPALRTKNTNENYFQGIDKYIEGMKGSDYMLMVIAEPIPMIVVNSMIKKLFDLSSDIHSYVKQTLTKTKGSSDSVNIGMNINPSLIQKAHGWNFFIYNTNISKLLGSNKGLSLGYSRTWFRATSVSVEILNKMAEHAEQLCNKFIERLQAGKNMGFWNVGVYQISSNDYIQYKGTSLLSSILSGDQTYYEPFRSVPLKSDTWDKYLMHFTNPQYKILLYGDENYLRNKLKYDYLVVRWITNQKRKEEQFKQEFLSLSEAKQKELISQIKNANLLSEVDKLVEQAWQELKENKSVHPLGAIMGGVSTPLNTDELAIIMNLPRKEVTGVPVLQKTEFGRNIRTFEPKEGDNIDIGELRYLGIGEKNRLELNLNSLTAHTFITGTTGSGKSNTVFNILDKISGHKVRFLVIEPAKGEYKTILGGIEGVKVFGTNQKYTELLRINPFRFPKEIHVLEHLDRLTEIFSACWPMYAAMPALLKEGMERVYQKKGWDLESSQCLEDTDVYPTVQDLVEVMPSIVKQSGYSDEVKANYHGALVSRLKSLTNGLYRWILSDDEIDNQVLFDDNCIVDISRIGSMETKALLMGILIMRLYEHRISKTEPENANLNHVTILEEAHHLMRRTSISQNEEYANIQGKAVEMITNSIAEMRTYGEGFFLVDQAPGLLDLTAIRNTNTKIIMRLPEQSDKEIVGFSTNLNENQIKELSRLETGEAVVYQNDWLQAVSGKIDWFNDKKRKAYNYDYQEAYRINRDNQNMIMQVLLNPIISFENKMDLSNIDVDKLKNWLTGSPVNSKVKAIIKEILDQRGYHAVYQSNDFQKLSYIVGRFFSVHGLLSLDNEVKSVEAWNDRIIDKLKKSIDFPNKEFQIEFLHLIICDYAHTRNLEEINRFYFSWVEKNINNGALLC
jgi:hypothetical protein